MDLTFLNPITILSSIGGAAGVSIDILTKRVENYENIITQNPIEDGSPTTDHITNLPPKITLSGGFSDLRISNLVGTVALPSNASKGLAKTNFDKLLDLYVSRATFDVMDGLHLFKNMQFKNLKEIKDKEGFSVFFEAEIWHIIKVNLDVVSVPVETMFDALNRFVTQAQLLMQVGTITESYSLKDIGILA